MRQTVVRQFVVRRFAATAALAALVALGGCQPAASPDLGLHALLRVQGAQFVPGTPPATDGGPAVTSAQVGNANVHVGRSTALSGLVPKPTQAVQVALRGDVGYWVVQPGTADPQLPDQLTFVTRAQFSPNLPTGPLVLDTYAVAPDGKVGPARSIALTSEGPTQATGELVVTLRWDSEADLDLHVVDPGGIEIWRGNINSYQPPPPGQLPDPDAWKAGGILDFDSNAACVIDGRRQEDVYWQQTPPSGHYQVRVDVPSLCSEVGAFWTATVTLHGQLLKSAQGQARDSDTRGLHGEGSGLRALEFDVP